MNEQAARSAATAGVMTAAAVVYALAAIYLPVLTMMMGMLWPVFIALVTVRIGLRCGVLAAAAVMTPAVAVGRAACSFILYPFSGGIPRTAIQEARINAAPIRGLFYQRFLYSLIAGKYSPL